MRVLVGSDAEILSPVFVAADGETAVAADATPTCTVADGAGTALAAPLVMAVEPGLYAAALTAAAHTAALDTLTLTWSATVSGKVQRTIQTVEVAGGTYVALSTLRQIPALDNADKFSTLTLRTAREEFEDIAEHYLGVAFVPRAARETIIGTGQCHLMLGCPMPRLIRSLTVDGVTIDVSTVELAEAGWITRDQGWARGAVVDIVYEHGFDTPTGPIVRACIEFVRAGLLQSASGLPRNTIDVSFDGLSLRASTADIMQRRPTGWLTVDAALNQAPSFAAPAVA
jgi:hypothetical protein